MKNILKIELVSIYLNMGFGSHYVSSPRFCFSTEDYNEWMNQHYPNNKNDDDDEKLIPDWFDLNSP